MKKIIYFDDYVNEGDSWKEDYSENLEKITKIIGKRAKELSENPEVQKEMMKFSNKEEGLDWLYKTALATLVLSKEDLPKR